MNGGFMYRPWPVVAAAIGALLLFALLVTGADSALATAVPGDTYEPNDSTSTATPLVPDGTIYTQYCDVSPGADYSSFAAKGGKTYQVEVAVQGYWCWGMMGVFDGAGKWLTTEPQAYTFLGSVPEAQSWATWMSPDSDTVLYVGYLYMNARSLLPYTIRVTERDRPVIRGTVRDMKTGSPVPGIRVRAYVNPSFAADWLTPFYWDSVHDTTTTAEGTYSVEALYPGSAVVQFEDSPGPWLGEWYDSTPWLWAYSDGYPIRAFKSVAIPPDGVITGIDGVVARPGAVEVKCTRADTGEAVPGTRLIINGQSGNFWGLALHMPYSDAAGRSTYGGLDPHRGYGLYVGAPSGFQVLSRPDIWPSAGETQSVAVSLGLIPSAIELTGPPSKVVAGNRAPLTGILSWNGSGVGTVTVSFESSRNGVTWRPSGTATTTPGGQFSISAVPTITTAYRAVFGGTRDQGPGESIPVTVTVDRPTRIALTTPFQVIDYGAEGRVPGNLKAGSWSLPGERVELWSSADNITWKSARVTQQTGVGGKFDFSVAPKVRTYYRVSFALRNDLLPSQSTYTRITPRASVSPPAAPAIMSHAHTYAVSGALRPTHLVGSYPVRVHKWRYASGEWVYAGFVYARASAQQGYTKYTANVKLPKTGRWRLRAYHSDTGHAESWSDGFDYVTVK